MKTFDDLYHMLICKIKNEIKYHCDVNIVTDIPYCGKIITIEFDYRIDTSEPFVKDVYEDNVLTNWYSGNNRIPLKVWMKEQSHSVIELEKTIIMMS